MSTPATLAVLLMGSPLHALVVGSADRPPLSDDGVPATATALLRQAQEGGLTTWADAGPAVARDKPVEEMRAGAESTQAVLGRLRTFRPPSVLHRTRVAQDVTMANLTITVDPELLRRARVRAAELGTSVNAVIRDFMRSWVGEASAQADAVGSLLARSRKARSGRAGRKWTRDQLHER